MSGCVAALTAADAEPLNGVTFTSVSGMCVCVCVSTFLHVHQCVCGVCVCFVLCVTDEEEKSYFVKTRSARKHRSNTNKRKTTRGHDKV